MYGCVQCCPYHTGIYSEYEYILLLYRGGLLTNRPDAMSVSGYIWMLHVSCVVYISTKSLRKTMFPHYGDVIMDAIASQITSLTIVYSDVYSDSDQRKHQSSASLAFLRGIHRGPVNSPHKWSVTRKMFSFDDVIMIYNMQCVGNSTSGIKTDQTDQVTVLFIVRMPSQLCHRDMSKIMRSLGHETNNYSKTFSVIFHLWAHTPFMNGWNIEI